MATLLIVLLMAFNMWMVIYLTWERRTGDTTREKNGKDGGNRTAVSEIVGRSRFRMPETKPQTATPAPNAATEIRSEEVDEKDVTFADEAQEDGTDTHRRRIPDEELDEVFTDRRVSDIAGYDGQRAVCPDRTQLGGDTQETGRTDGLLSGLDTCPTFRINGKCRTEKAACHAGEIRGFQYPRLCITL